MAKNKKDLIIQSTCEVWAVSYMSETGLFNTWGIYQGLFDRKPGI